MFYRLRRCTQNRRMSPSRRTVADEDLHDPCPSRSSWKNPASPGSGKRSGRMKPSADPVPTRLARQLGTFDAVVIGLGAMIGAGIFAVIAPAAGAAGTGLLAGLVIAACVA